MVIGLDGADPFLVFDRLADSLPCLSRLAAAGSCGPLASTVPPMTMPAWVSMFTGRDPGELGIYGFRIRADRSYGNMRLASARPVDAPRVWDRLSEAGFTSYLLGVPGTWPPWPIRGRMVSGILAPGPEAEYVWPREYKRKLELLAGGYVLDVTDFRTEDKTRLLGNIEKMTRKRFRVARAWAAEPDWDLFVMVEMGPDRMHHGFWRFFDPAHRLYRPGHELSSAIPDYYALLDSEIDSLLEAAGPDTSVLIVSDHGTRAMQGGFRINEWLIQQGDLVLKYEPAGPCPLQPDMVDWPRTRAWGEGGYYGRVTVNLKEREPAGAVSHGELDEYRKDLAQRFEATVDEHGRPLGTRVLWPEQEYRQVRGIAPDLMVYFGDLAWRSIGQVGFGAVHSRTNDTGPDDANHAHEGIVIFFDPRRPKGNHPRVRSILEIAPLVLTHFGQGEGAK